MPCASQCQTSTVAPASGEQALPVTCETRNTSASGTPSFTEPSEGSGRMSDRLSCSSTKYGPSVISGRTTQDGDVTAVATADAGVGRLDGDRVGTLDGACVGSPVGCPVPDCPGAQAASTAAPAAPMSASASLRLRTRPTG